MPHARINDNIVGQRLREARERAKIEQEDLCAMLAVDYDITMGRTVLSRVEHNKRPVRDRELFAFCQILNVSADWVLGLKR